MKCDGILEDRRSEVSNGGIVYSVAQMLGGGTGFSRA